MNPLVRVPVLILETGEHLIESGIIIDHLDHTAGQARSLTPGNGAERRKVLFAVALATGAMDKALAVFMERRNHAAKAISHEWERRCLAQLIACLVELEKLCGTPWFHDLHMSQADVSVGCMIGFIKIRVPEIFPADKYPKLHRLALHCEMREEFTACRPSAAEIGTVKS